MVDFKELWSSVDWFVLVAYFAGVLLVGVSMRKRAGKNLKSFFSASRKLTIPILIGVAAAGWYDSWVIVGLAECGWLMGVSIVFVFIIPEAIVRLPIAMIIGPHVREQIPDWVLTLPDLFHYLYDKKVKLIAAVTNLAGALYDSALLWAVAEVLRLITGIDIVVSLIVCGGIVIIYTALSGLWGLAVTDLIQFAIMMISAGALAIGIINEFGGLNVIFDAYREINPVLMTPMGENTPWEVIAWVVSACAMYASAQSYQRFGSAKGGREIKVSYSLMILIGMLFSMVMVFAGMASRVGFESVVSSSAEGFWALVFTTLPIGMRGLFVAALCAAVMSTVSADWLIYSSYAVNDIGRGFLKPSMTEKGTVFGMRIGIVVVGILTTIGTLFWADGIANAFYYIGGFMFSMFAVPLVVGMFYKKKTAQAGLYSILYSTVAYAVWEFVLACPGGVPTSVFVAVTGAIVYFAVCSMTYKNTPQNESIEGV